MKNYQNVTDLPNNNTVFLVWVFKKDLDKAQLTAAFAKICALIGNRKKICICYYNPGKRCFNYEIGRASCRERV